MRAIPNIEAHAPRRPAQHAERPGHAGAGPPAKLHPHRSSRSTIWPPGLNINPLEMRLRNLPPNDANDLKNNPNSTAYLAIRNTLYRREIEIIRKLSNWDQAWHRPGAGNGMIKTGMGMALHTWGGGGGGPNPDQVTISADGSVLVQSAIAGSRHRPAHRGRHHRCRDPRAATRATSPSISATAPIGQFDRLGRQHHDARAPRRRS